jgi:hypothetical protein
MAAAALLVKWRRREAARRERGKARRPLRFMIGLSRARAPPVLLLLLVLGCMAAGCWLCWSQKERPACSVFLFLAPCC